MVNVLQERIAALAETKIGEISGLAGVSRPPVDLFDLDASSDLPHVILRQRTTQDRWHLRGAEEQEIEFEALCAAATKEAVVNLIGEVKKKVNANELWVDGSTALAVGTMVVEDRVHEVEVAEEIQSGVVRFVVHARADRTDPTAPKAI